MGSTMAAKEKPTTVSTSAAPAWIAACSTARLNENASPIRSSLTIRTAASPPSVGTCWPAVASGIIASDMAAAIMRRARAGIMRDEKMGASRKRLPTRESPSRKPMTSLVAMPGSVTSTQILRLRAHELGDAHQQVVRVEQELVQHPRPGERHHGARDDDLGDEGERLLLDLRHGLEHGHDHAHDEAGQQERHGDLQRD